MAIIVSQRQVQVVTSDAILLLMKCPIKNWNVNRCLGLGD
jgi:hypothetical protein